MLRRPACSDPGRGFGGRNCYTEEDRRDWEGVTSRRQGARVLTLNCCHQGPPNVLAPALPPPCTRPSSRDVWHGTQAGLHFVLDELGNTKQNQPSMGRQWAWETVR